MLGERFEKPICICGYHQEPSTLRSSTSGGLATALAENTISHGGVVYGVVYSPDFDGAEYLRVDNYLDIKKIQGTKYCDVKAVCNGEDVYDLVIKDLKNREGGGSSFHWFALYGCMCN